MVKKRVAWKLPFIHMNFFKKRILYKNNLLLRLRHSLISKTLVSKKMRLYNGIWYLSTDITGQMIGFKTGAFSFTRRCELGIHSKDKRKRKKMALKKLKKKQKLIDNEQ